MGGHCLLISAVLIMLNIHVHAQFVNITLLQNAVAVGAVCLDGSPSGYHYYKGFGDGVDNWIVYLSGGGWCATADSCLRRVKTQPEIASTANITTAYFGGILSSTRDYNPGECSGLCYRVDFDHLLCNFSLISDFYNWNKVYVRYCDGSSFVGDVEAVDPGTNLHYRGSRIFGAVVNELLANGLENAHNVILTGNSAGGLATILNCDRFRALVPNASRVKCISDSGFFIRAKDLPNAVGREMGYKNVVALHGVEKYLPASCTSRMDPGLCFFPENLVGGIQTPLFLLNSAFDRFQISVNLKPYHGDEQGWASCTNNTETCTPAQLQVIKDFRNTFLETLKNIGDSSTTGLLINSCYIHDYIYLKDRWSFHGSPRSDKSIAQGIGDWYFDRSIVKLIDTQTEHPLNCHLARNM